MTGQMSAHTTSTQARKQSIRSSDGDTATANESSDSEPSKKCAINIETVEKWIGENEKTLQMSTWLKYNKGRGGTVLSLKCKLCIRYQEKIESCKNYNPAFILGSNNLHTSTFKDHARSEMDQKVCSLFMKSKAVSVTDYAPIARALEKKDTTTASNIKWKFEIAYFICKQHLPFTEMGPICSLEEKHGVHLGTGYKSDKACAGKWKLMWHKSYPVYESTLSH